MQNYQFITIGLQFPRFKLRSECCQQVLVLSCWRRGVDDCKPIASECDQETSTVLGSRYNVDRLTIRELNVLGSVVKMVDSAHVTWVSSLTAGSQWQTTLRQFVGRLIISCGKFDTLSVHCRWMQQRRWSRHSSPVGGITATQRHHREPFPTPVVVAKRSSQTDHTNRTAWAHYAGLTTSLAACLTPSGIQAGHSHVQGSSLHGLAQTYLSDDCLLVVEVSQHLLLADAQTCVVLYHRPGASLVTGVLLWVVRGSGTVYRLHCVTLTVFTASEISRRRFCLVAAAAHSDYVFLCATNTFT